MSGSAVFTESESAVVVVCSLVLLPQAASNMAAMAKTNIFFIVLLFLFRYCVLLFHSV
jgi:hypothetical protein